MRRAVCCVYRPTPSWATVALRTAGDNGPTSCVRSTTYRTPSRRAAVERVRRRERAQGLDLLVEALRLEAGVSVHARIAVVDCQKLARSLDERPHRVHCGRDRELEYDALRARLQRRPHPAVVFRRRDSDVREVHGGLRDHDRGQADRQRKPRRAFAAREQRVDPDRREQRNRELGRGREARDRTNAREPGHRVAEHDERQEDPTAIDAEPVAEREYEACDAGQADQHEHAISHAPQSPTPQLQPDDHNTRAAERDGDEPGEQAILDARNEAPRVRRDHWHVVEQLASGRRR